MKNVSAVAAGSNEGSTEDVSNVLLACAFVHGATTESFHISSHCDRTYMSQIGLKQSAP